MPKQTMGEFLSILRKAAGFTQQDIADKLGISAKTVSSWETDRTCPDLSLLPVIADIYGVTCDELLRGERDCIPPEEKNEVSKTKQAEQGAKTTEALLNKNYSSFMAKSTLVFGLGSACSLALVNAAYHVQNYRLLSVFLTMGFLSCLHLLQYFFNKAWVFGSSDKIGLRYRKSVAETFYAFYRRSFSVLIISGYVFVSYKLIRDILRSDNIEQMTKNAKTTIGALIFFLAIRFFLFFTIEKGLDKTLVYCINPEDTVIFRKKRALVNKRFYKTQAIVSAVCLIPVALYLVGVIRLHLHFAMLAPVILFLQKLPIHLYYAEGRGEKHIVLPEEAQEKAPIENEKSA